MFDYRIEGRWKRQEEIIRGKVWKMIKEEKKIVVNTVPHILRFSCRTTPGFHSAASKSPFYQGCIRFTIFLHQFTSRSLFFFFFYHNYYWNLHLISPMWRKNERKIKTFAKTVFFLEVFLLPYTCFTCFTPGPLIRARCVQMSFTGGSNYMITWSTNRLE